MINNTSNEKLESILKNSCNEDITIVGRIYKLYDCRSGYFLFKKNTGLLFYGHKLVKKYDYDNCYDIDIKLMHKERFYYMKIMLKKYKIIKNKLTYSIIHEGFKVDNMDKVKAIIKYFNEPRYKFLNTDIRRRIKLSESYNKRMIQQEKDRIERERMIQEENKKFEREKKIEERKKIEYDKMLIERLIKDVFQEVNSDEYLKSLFWGYIEKYCYNNMLYLKDEILASGHWNNFLKLILMKIDIKENNIDKEYVVWKVVEKISVEFFSSKWENEYGEYFINIKQLSLEECIERYLNIQHLEHTLEENIGRFIYYLIYNDKLDTNCRNRVLELINKKLECKVINEFEKDLVTESLKNLNKYDIEYVDLLSGLEFEIFISNLFDKMGYYTMVTQNSRDQGIDIISEKKGRRIGIQTKCYCNNVSNSAVQEVVAGLNFYKCDIGMVVTNSYFTSSAKELAKVNRIILWDRKALVQKIDQFY